MKTPRIHLTSSVLLLSVISLTGCLSVYSTYKGPAEISASNALKITINQKIPVKPGTTRTFIQDGKLVDRFDHYKSNCNIEISQRDDDNWQYIEASQYTVTGSQFTNEYVVERKTFKPLQLALNNTDTRSDFLLADAFDDGDLSDIYLGIHYYLSGKDKNVMRLSCRGAYDSPQNAEYPTREEIVNALGEVATMEF